jgi:hypothetical protein
VATVGNFSLALRIGEKLNEVLLVPYSTVSSWASPGPSTPSSTGSVRSARWRTNNSSTSNTTTSKKCPTIPQATSSRPTAWGTPDSTRCSSICSSSSPIWSMSPICSISKTSPGSSYGMMQGERAGQEGSGKVQVCQGNQ